MNFIKNFPVSFLAYHLAKLSQLLLIFYICWFAIFEETQDRKGCISAKIVQLFPIIKKMLFSSYSFGLLQQSHTILARNWNPKALGKHKNMLKLCLCQKYHILPHIPPQWNTALKDQTWQMQPQWQAKSLWKMLVPHALQKAWTARDPIHTWRVLLILHPLLPAPPLLALL